MNRFFAPRAVAAFVSISAITSAAHGQSPRKETAGGLITDSPEKYVMVTGSNIPQKVKRKSIGTDTAFNVRIFTQRELMSTGRPTVGEALALDPAVQLSSRR